VGGVIGGDPLFYVEVVTTGGTASDTPRLTCLTVFLVMLITPSGLRTSDANTHKS